MHTERPDDATRSSTDTRWSTDTRSSFAWPPPDPVTGQLTRRPPAVSRRTHLIGAGAAGLVVVLGLGAALAFGSSASGSPTLLGTNRSSPTPAAAPTVAPSATDTPHPTTSDFDSAAPETPAPSTTASGPTSVLVDDLQVGDCLKDPITKIVLLKTVAVVPCGKPHAEEVFANYDLSGTTFPGLPTVRRQADQGCEQRFSAFVGRSYQYSSLQLANLHPTAEVWAHGRKTVTCVVGPASGTTSGSLRNSRR